MARTLLLVIGMGQDGPAGLCPRAKALLTAVKVLAGGRRLLDFFPDWPGEKIFFDGDLESWLERVRDRYRSAPTAILASGDPLYYGIGRAILQSFPHDELVFLPHVSSVQLAFARLKETWNDARVVSVHGRPLESLLLPLRLGEPKIAVLTDPKNDPAAISRLLEEHGFGRDYDMWLCEDLDGPSEQTELWKAGARPRLVAPLNVVILLRKPPGPKQHTRGTPLLGIPDPTLVHRNGMITSREVRLLVLGYLELQPGDVLWDIGAGSGSIAVEAARLSPHLRVFAVDRDAHAAGFIKENAEKLHAANVNIVFGEAPQALAGLPDPDRIFIGGSGGRLVDILASAGPRLKADGQLVLTCITLETMHTAWSWLVAHDWHIEATSVQIAHSRPLGPMHCFEPEHPVTILRAQRRPGASTT
jgi:precorrin-6Y C5,15-methyltransferase (decarboxylating)